VTCPAGVKGRGAALHQLFRHRFIATLVREKLLSDKKARQLLNWKHSGFSLDAGDRPVNSAAGRQQLAEYLLRAPFSLEKITWVEKTKRVIYRSSRNWRTNRNFEVFTATGFLAAAVEHIPPKNRHTIRYYPVTTLSRGTGLTWRPLLQQVPRNADRGVEQPAGTRPTGDRPPAASPERPGPPPPLARSHPARLG